MGKFLRVLALKLTVTGGLLVTAMAICPVAAAPNISLKV